MMTPWCSRCWRSVGRVWRRSVCARSTSSTPCCETWWPVGRPPRSRLTGPRRCCAASARRLASSAPIERKQLAWDLVREIRGLDAALKSITQRMVEALEARPSRLLDIDGVGPVLAARLIGRCGRASRFPSADAFASYAGTAPPWRHPAANGSATGSPAAATAS